MGVNYKNITEAFQRFQKDRHNEDKGRHFNELQEVYASTELFDLTRLNLSTTEDYDADVILDAILTVDDILSDLSLPFAALFIHIKDKQFLLNGTLINSNLYIQTREFDPVRITGTLYEIREDGRSNLPFTVNVKENLLTVLNHDYVKSGISYSRKEIVSLILEAYKYLNSLSKKSVLVNTPTPGRKEYYRRKGKPTLTVPNRNVYYVLHKDDSKSEPYLREHGTGTFEFSHAFKVRGHWRTLQSNESLGKDRNGDRVVKGYTWVTEYIKGDEENLIKKLHIVKE